MSATIDISPTTLIRSLRQARADAAVPTAEVFTPAFPRAYIDRREPVDRLRDRADDPRAISVHHTTRCRSDEQPVLLTTNRMLAWFLLFLAASGVIQFALMVAFSRGHAP
jgi:hypothetical protein